MTSPANCLRSTASDLISHSASTAVNKGLVAVRIPATEEVIRSSPQAVRNVGRAMSSTATTATGAIMRRAPRNARPLTASGMRTTAPSKVRPNATADGGMCSTANPNEQERAAPDDRRGGEQQHRFPGHRLRLPLLATGPALPGTASAMRTTRLATGTLAVLAGSDLLQFAHAWAERATD
jgi:hypothetical protein